MSLESRKTYYLQVCIYLRAVVNYLQHLSIKRRTFIASQPLGIHVRKQAAERVAYKLFKGHLFQPCQRRITVSENPVHSMPFIIKYHLYIREGEWHIIKAAVMPAVLFLRCGDIRPDKAVDELLLT